MEEREILKTIILMNVLVDVLESLPPQIYRNKVKQLGKAFVTEIEKNHTDSINAMWKVSEEDMIVCNELYEQVSGVIASLEPEQVLTVLKFAKAVKSGEAEIELK